MYGIFQRDYGIQLTEINQMLSAVVLEGSDLKAFLLEKPIPAFRVEGASFCGKDLIIEMEDSVYRGDITGSPPKRCRIFREGLSRPAGCKLQSVAPLEHHC